MQGYGASYGSVGNQPGATPSEDESLSFTIYQLPIAPQERVGPGEQTRVCLGPWQGPSCQMPSSKPEDSEMELLAPTVLRLESRCLPLPSGKGWPCA